MTPVRMPAEGNRYYSFFKDGEDGLMDILSSMNFRQEGRADEYGLLVRWHRSLPWALYLVAIEGITFIRARNPRFFQQKGGGMEHGEGKARIKKNISAGVIAGFAVDVHAAGEVRRLGVIQPVIVGEPCVGGTTAVNSGRRSRARGKKAGESVFLISSAEEVAEATLFTSSFSGRIALMWVWAVW